MDLFNGFESYTKSRSYSERISLSASGGISFNTTAYNELNLEKYAFASFFYNKASRQIGIRFSVDKKEGAYQLKPRDNAKNEKALYLSIKGFVMAYKPVLSGKVQKYEVANKAESEGVLDIVLNPIMD